MTENIRQRSQDATHGDIYGGVYNIGLEEPNRASSALLEHLDATAVQYMKESGIKLGGVLPSSLMKTYRENLKTVISNKTRVKGRRWIDSVQVQAIAASLSKKSRKYWFGPTIGVSRLDREHHRNRKRILSNVIFRCLLTHDIITHRGGIGEDGSPTPRLCDKTVKTGGYKTQGEYSLFAQYIARVEQLPTEDAIGYTAYTPMHRGDFDQMSRKRQLFELKKIGLSVESVEDAQKFFIKPDDRYPSTHTIYELPNLHPATMKTADILSHHHHIITKIARLRKLQRESRREAVRALRWRRRDARTVQGRDLSIGTQRARNMYLINRSIASHVKLIQQLDDQLKKRYKAHNTNRDQRFINEDEAPIQPTNMVERNTRPHRVPRPRGCRHHLPKALERVDSDGSISDNDSEQPTFLQELRRQRLRRWEQRGSKIHYRSAHDRVGGVVLEKFNQYLDTEGTITVCTLNVRGFDDGDNKLELVLQFLEDEKIDVMICIDAQLDEKRGHWYGKIAKRRLGIGTRTNTNPCITDHGDGLGPCRRVGGIFTIIRPRWGTSLVTFQKDKFGLDGKSAGIMSQVTLATHNARLNIIGVYWPNQNRSGCPTDTTLWNCLQRYIRSHNGRDANPTELLQRVSQQWIATAYKNGSRGSILCGDLNATWTSSECGGQAVIQNWAEAFSLRNGIRRVSQRLHCDMYTRGGDGQPRSWIDHVLHKGAPEYIDCLAGYTSQAAEWVGISDHKPIWGVYKVHPPLQKCPKKMKQVKVRYELQLTDRQKCDEFVEAMETLLHVPAPTDDSTDAEVIEYMRKLEQHSGDTVKRIYQRHGQVNKRSSRKDGWSPMYIAHKVHLTSLIEIRRSLLGHAHRDIWTSADAMRQELPDILQIWESTLDGLELSDAQKEGIHQSTERSLTWWKALDTLPDTAIIDTDIDAVKKLLHGTTRTEMRRRINVNIRRREDLRRDGKWKRVITSLLGNLAGRRHQPGIDLNLISTEEGHILGDSKEIHDAITDRFEEWFDDPDQCQGDLHKGDNWEQCRDSEAHFLQDTAYTGAPVELRRLIHRAIAQVPHQQTMRNELQDILKQAPSLLEFESAIQLAKTNSSAGISGCSYNQLKKWPAGLIRNLHYCLSRIWMSHSTPTWWSSRWLVVIPKKPEEIPHVGNMRPLILIEAVRKIWCKLLLQRILTVWQKHNALHRYQHGFIRGRSTMTASTLFINLLEDALENHRPIHTCTWDITKAFDSVSKNIMKLAWTRLGVPDDWVQWLVGLDVGGTTTVRTPHAINIWNTAGVKGLRQRTCRRSETRCPDDASNVGYIAEGFHAVRGTGQGDVTSPTCWAAIFDILLTALHIDIQDTCRHVSSEANHGYGEGETAYADDLLSSARTPEALQRKADIVSTFCSIMGLQLSTSKLRRFVMAHSGMDEDETPPTIIHRYNNSYGEETWAADTISATAQGVLEYLGGKYDTDGSTRTVLSDMKQTALSHCAEISNTAASAQTKLSCAKMTTYSKLRYKAKLASTTLSELEAIDKIFYQFHTKVTKNMKSFPYDLLYQSSVNGGVGLQQFSDLASMDKLSELFRALSRTDETMHAMSGLLQRMARSHGHDIHHGHSYRYHHKRGSRSWLRSPIEWLHKHNLYLCRGGVQPSLNTLSSPISMVIPGLTSAQSRKLRLRHLYHLSDIIDDRSGYRTWSLSRQDDWLRNLLPDEPPEDQNTILWPGQFWQPYVDCEGLRPSNILEVVHVLDDNRMEIGIWKMSTIQGEHIKYTKEDGHTIVNIGNVFRGSHTERWDQTGLRGTTCSFQRPRLVPKPTPTVDLIQPDPEWVQQAVQFCSDQGPTYRPRIYTDGSYLETDHDIHSVFDGDAVTKKSSAGIAIMHDGPDWRDRPIYALHIPYGDDIGAKSAYTMEYLALAIAMRLQSSTLKATAVCSDSRAVLKRITNRREHLGRADESHRLLLQSIDTSLKGGAVVPRWVPSHPERRKPDNTNWLQDDWGNYIADKVACRGAAALRSVHANIQWHIVSAIDIINTLPRKHEYYLGDFSGRPRALYGLTDHIHRLRFQRYVHRREGTYAGSSKWSDSTITFAAATFNGRSTSEGQFAHTSRIIWDKHWHGRNRAKQQLSEDERAEVTRCHMCKEIDSQHHCFRTCMHSNVRAIRDETAASLRVFEQQHSRWYPDDESEDEHRLKLGLIRGIIHEFHNCEDAGRVWTGNWSRAMIERLQTNSGTTTITKRLCRRLRVVVTEMYAIISQGANDIMDVRHGVQRAQDTHRRHRPNVEAIVPGQRSIVDYLTGTRGLTGLELRAAQTVEAEEDDHTVVSDGSISNDSQWGDDEDTESSVWMQHSAQELTYISNILSGAQHDRQVLSQIDNYCIRAGSLRRLQQGREIDAPIIDGYLRLLQAKSLSSIKCMGTSFFRRLYNPAGEIRHMPRNTFNLGYASQHFNHIDVFQHQSLIIPVLVRSHWALITVDTVAKQLRYLDSQGGDGAEYLAVIKRWLANRWRATHGDDFNCDEWRIMPSNWAYVPQQMDQFNCGVFALMFAELISKGEDISRFNSSQCAHARLHILHRLLASELRCDVTTADGSKNTVSNYAKLVGDIGSVSPTPDIHCKITTTRKRRSDRNLLTSAISGGKRVGADRVTPAGSPVSLMPAGPCPSSVTGSTAEINPSDIYTLQPGGWLTDLVITRYFELLQARSDTDGSQQLFLSAQFYNRLFDPDTSTIRSHLRSHDTARNLEGLTELDILRQMHGHMDLLHCTRAYVPVAQRQHWGLIEVDNASRVITYYDSLRNGGAHFGRVIRDYLLQYEDEVGMRIEKPWLVRYSIRPGLALHGLCQVPVPTQTNGNDCGVFVCLFADLLAREQDLMQYANLDMDNIRLRIRQSLHENTALKLSDRTGLDPRPRDTMMLQKSVDDLPSDTDMPIPPDEPELAGTNHSIGQGLRRSNRANKCNESMAESVTTLDMNYQRLTIRKSKDMGWGLYATEPFSYKTDRIICTYHGRKISAHQAKSKANKSRYVVELLGANQRLVYIDGFDTSTQLCYSAGPYANDGIHESHRRDLWNAELTIDDYNADVFVIRPLRDIKAGEQIYVWYGPRYWCSDEYTVEQMCNAVITYGIDISSSTCETHGNWRRLKKYRALQSLLDSYQYVPPKKMTDLTNIRSIPSTLISPLDEATMEEIPFDKLPTIVPTRQRQATMIHSIDIKSKPMSQDRTAIREVEERDNRHNGEDTSVESTTLSQSKVSSKRPRQTTTLSPITQVSRIGTMEPVTVHDENSLTKESGPRTLTAHDPEFSSDDDMLPPQPTHMHYLLPRFRVGSNPTSRRKKLSVSRVRLSAANSGGTKRTFRQALEDGNATQLSPPNTIGKRRRLQDQDVTAPDAVADGVDVVEQTTRTGASPAIPHVYIDVPNNQPKRKATQAKLRDYYRSKRTRLD